MSVDVIWAFISFIITLLVLSYIFGDNPLFRLATYLFIGVTAGYAVVLAIWQVLWPKLVKPIAAGSYLELVPLVLGFILLTKIFPRYARFGTIPMAFLVGTAAAVAIGGAVFGTLIGQAQGAVNEFDLAGAAGRGLNPLLQGIEATLLLVGTITTLAYFQYTARTRPGQPAERPKIVETLAQIGKVFIAITLGALFAGVFSASIMALIERLDFLLKVIFTYIIK